MLKNALESYYQTWMKNMNKKLITAFILLSVSAVALAGYGRAGSGGFRSSSNFSGSRFYSSPSRSYSSYQSRPTVVREYHHTTTNHAPMVGGGMGIGSTIAASAAGSMIGNALTGNHGSPSSQPPQVVYLNGQPQQVSQNSQYQPQSEQVQPMVQDNLAKKDDSSNGFFYLILAIFISLCAVVSYKIGRSN